MKALKYSHSTFTGTSPWRNTQEPDAVYRKEQHTIVAMDEDFEYITAGSASLFEVHFTLVDELGVGLYELFDSTSDLFEIYEVLQTTPNLDAEREYDSWRDLTQALPLIVLDRLQIAEPHRGNGLARAFLSQQIETCCLRGGALLILNAEPFELHSQKDSMSNSDYKRELKSEREKLRHIYSSLGFKRISESSNVMYMIAE